MSAPGTWSIEYRLLREGNPEPRTSNQGGFFGVRVTRWNGACGINNCSINSPMPVPIPFSTYSAPASGTRAPPDKLFTRIVALYDPITQRLVMRDKVSLIWRLGSPETVWHAVYEKSIWRRQSFPHISLSLFHIFFDGGIPLLYIEELRRGVYSPTAGSLLMSELFRLAGGFRWPSSRVDIEMLFEDESSESATEDDSLLSSPKVGADH